MGVHSSSRLTDYHPLSQPAFLYLHLHLAPHEPISRYLHNRTGEDNGDAHLKRQVMGREGKAKVDGFLDRGLCPRGT
jgi:thiamine phosphate synthase YjbQ (UPF0047 family)